MIYSSFYIPVYRNKKSLKYATCQGCTRHWKGKTIVERLLMCLFNDVFDIVKEMWNPSTTHLLWNINTKCQCLVMKCKAYVHQIGSNYEFGHFFYNDSVLFNRWDQFWYVLHYCPITADTFGGKERFLEHLFITLSDLWYFLIIKTLYCFMKVHKQLVN